MDTKEQKADLCEICDGDSKRVSEMFCLQCEQSYCESCGKAHLKTKVSNSHKLVRFDELQSGIDSTHNFKPVFCDKHTDRLIELYCLDDEVAICMMCCVLDHRSHRYKEIKNIAIQFRSAKWKQDLQKALRDVEGKLGTLSSRKLRLSDEINCVENQICEEADKKIQLIKKHKQKLVSSLKTIKTHREQEMDSVDQELTVAKVLLSTFIDYCDELSDVDICREKNSICKKTEELVDMSYLDISLEKISVKNVVFFSSSATFEDTKSTLGELESVKSGVLNESEDELMSQGTSTVTDRPKSGVFSESKHKSMSSVTPSVTDVATVITIRETLIIKLFITHDNHQLLFTLDQPPTDSFGPRQVRDIALLDKYLCVVYSWHNKAHVFSYKDRFKKIKEIQINEMNSPIDMVGCSVTSQLFVSECFKGNIWRVNVNTGVCDVFIKLAYNNMRLSLVENRFLVTSRDSLLMYDIHSGLRMKNIPLTEDMKKYRVEHAIESNKDSFFVSHGQSKGGNNTVSEIDSEGRVIRVFDNKEKLNCVHLALDSVGRLLVVDINNYRIVLLDEHLTFMKVLLDRERFDGARPVKLKYDKNNNRLTVGLDNGHVKIFDCHVF